MDATDGEMLRQVFSAGMESIGVGVDMIPPSQPSWSGAPVVTDLVRVDSATPPERIEVFAFRGMQEGADMSTMDAVHEMCRSNASSGCRLRTDDGPGEIDVSGIPDDYDLLTVQGFWVVEDVHAVPVEVSISWIARRSHLSPE
ncbi:MULTISPECIES: hypothetical protein [unclassified Pseudonocardia]|uniref:hypothetical protein n=1 Tax=unclassified Pseudonocardia TaxID=2619320 RepID=UPI00094B0766|nr:MULTISPECIES: hypothetical protein [unclassified Pseudonocardia]OLL73119.1 hypothetical protein Ae150APs1_1497c [Pseudonocardia sp. Ae150A_Ps1]